MKPIDALAAARPDASSRRPLTATPAPRPPSKGLNMAPIAPWSTALATTDLIKQSDPRWIGTRHDGWLWWEDGSKIEIDLPRWGDWPARLKPGQWARLKVLDGLAWWGLGQRWVDRHPPATGQAPSGPTLNLRWKGRGRVHLEVPGVGLLFVADTIAQPPKDPATWKGVDIKIADVPIKVGAPLCLLIESTDPGDPVRDVVMVEAAVS